MSISTDGGTTFAARTAVDGLGQGTVYSVYALGSAVYAGGQGGGPGEGLSISTDDGDHFTTRSMDDGLGSDDVLQVMADGSTVYASTTGGLSLSTDGGATFTNYTTDDGLGSNVVFGVSVVGPRIYVATAGGLSIAGPPPTPPTPSPTPSPTPVKPSGAPTDVLASPADRSATVSWTAPTTTGSFPISVYRAVSQPGGQVCLATAPVTSCTVSGLTNGTTYTFTVEALNGAGWGTLSTRSAPVTPSAPPLVRIVLDPGTRTADGRQDRIVTAGTTTGIPAGVQLTAFFRYDGQATLSQGKATITVNSDGTFTWSRRVRKSRALTAYLACQTTESNKVYWPTVR